jgi:adenosine deaminase
MNMPVPGAGARTPSSADGADDGLRAFIAQLPKTETHLHIEGALPLRLLRQVAPDRFADAPPPWWAPDFRFASFAQFEDALLSNAALWFTSPERYHQAAREVFLGLRAQNVRYVETSFHLPITQLIHADGREILAAIRDAAPVDLEVRVFAGMRRIDRTPALAPVMDQLASWDGLAGVDLHGVEEWALESWTAPLWQEVRAAGKVTKAHAGELCGPEKVRQVVEELGVRRVQHGVRAIEDPAVVQLLLDRDVTCDVCVTSNVKLGVVPSYEAHPIGRLLAAGVRCTVSTDDPFCFGGTLSDEYLYHARSLRFTPHQLARVARNGFEVAAISEPARQGVLDELDEMTRGT